MNLGLALVEAGKNYDEEMSLLGEDCRSPGYHSQLKPGRRVHPTRESFQYALMLLTAGGEKNVARGECILRRLILLQDTDPFSGTYGIWSWYYEEPIADMDPPDWNWADFCGAILAQILKEHASVLSVDLTVSLRAALGHAAWCIFRRNVRLDYTNIAVMGGGVAALAGEMLEEPCLVEFGRERLKRVVELTRYHGSFTEYNSPTYTMVVLEECERVMHLTQDKEVRDHADALRRMAWDVIAGHFDPATQQWAGPHARAYSDFISRDLAQYFSLQTGVRIEPHSVLAGASSTRLPSLVPSLPCPEELRGRFVRLPESPLELRQRFIRREDPAGPQPARFSSDTLVERGSRPKPRYSYGDRVGTTWFCETGSLGSISHEDTWNQRRALIGYFKTDQDLAVVLRLRFLHDGKDFCSGYVRQVQKGPRILSALSLLSDRGISHPVFDHPADDVFQAEDFRLRIQLTGSGVTSGSLSPLAFQLQCGGHCVSIHGLAGVFGTNEVVWECGGEDGVAWVDAVCYSGERQGFRFQEFPAIRVAAGIAWSCTGKPVSAGPVGFEELELGHKVTWGELSVAVPGPLDLYPV